MSMRVTFVSYVAALILLGLGGCAVTRGQESVGAHIDDASITSSLKSRYVGNKDVDASSIRVETLNGTVQLSGFAKNDLEKSAAESIAWKVSGVKAVRNELAIRP